MHNLIARITLFAFALSAGGCGIVGDKGAAVFHVGNNWQKAVPIAVGARFAVTAEKNDITHKALSVMSTSPAVIPVTTGGFQAVTAGGAQFQATDPATAIAVDTVEFTVASPASVSLGGWWSNLTGQPAMLPKKFGLVQGGRYVGAIVVQDATGTRLNHAGIATVTCEHATLKVTDDYVEATPTTLGATTAVVTVNGVTNAPVASATFDVQVVTAAEITKLTLTSATLQTGTSAPADADKGPVNPDPAATTTPATQLFLLVVNATLQDGTPVFGPTVTWSEDGNSHLLTKTSNGGNYAVLKRGETVTVTAALGALTAQVTVTAP
jgi:hypothetical protein